MPALTPQFVFDLETRMRMIQENEYLRLASNLWWNKCTKVLPSLTRREIVTWVINTASIEDQGDGGNIAFDNMMVQESEFTPKTAGKGLKLRRQQFEDLDGNGVQLASEWSLQIGAQHAYWPQKQVAKFLKDGSAIGYDGKAFFATDHPNNPKKLSAGTFKNLLTTGDAAPIDTGVTADVALANLSKVFSHITSIKMPNGDDPRFLRPSGILCSPKLYPRAVQITNARFIAQAAASGGGSGDVQALIAALGYGQPIMADELAGFESDTTYFVICEQVTASNLGGLVYIDREPFTTRYYTGRGGGTGVDAILDRADELEWHTSGRNALAPGHPFTIFKVKAT